MPKGQLIKKDKTKLKVLLIQLPFTQYSLWKLWGNVPLAAGYLKSTCYKTGLLGKVDIEILDERNSNLSGDAKLIDAIISKSPDILGFSLYCWNSMRSLFIAEKVKEKLPDVKIIAGGPEVAIDSKYILDNPAIDIGCFGEAEFTFVEVLRHILMREKDMEGIRGIFYKNCNEVIVTSTRPFVKSLNALPSPYLLGIINPRDYDMAWIETKRGCHYRCTYCGDNLRPLRLSPLDRIRKEIRLIVSKGVYNIKLLDSSFLTTPYFREICGSIKKLNAKKDLFISAELRAEDLNEKTVDLLKDCGVRTVELGLQSCSPTVLKNINRPTNLKKFIDGVRILKKKHIQFFIDLIIGLPGETLKSFRETFGFLKENKLIPHVSVFQLAILPGTKLKREKNKYGIEHQEKPPYLVTRTHSLSESDIKKCFEILSKAKRKNNSALKPYLLSGLMTSHLRTDYQSPKHAGKKHLSDIDIEIIDFPVTKIILELDRNTQNPDSLDVLSKKLGEKAGNPLTIWFISRDIESDLNSMKSFLNHISMLNPYLTWNIILETKNEFNLTLLDEIKKSILSKDDYSNKPKIFAIFPLKQNRISREWLNELNRAAVYFWHIEFIEKSGWKKGLEEILKKSKGLFVADFHPEAKIAFIIEVLKFIRRKRKNSYFLFKNLAIAHLQEKANFLQQVERIPNKLYECILSFDNNLQLSSCFLPDMASHADIIAWRYMILKKTNHSASRIISKSAQ